MIALGLSASFTFHFEATSFPCQRIRAFVKSTVSGVQKEYYLKVFYFRYGTLYLSSYQAYC